MKRSSRWRDRRFGKAPRGEGRGEVPGRIAQPLPSAPSGTTCTGHGHTPPTYPSDRQPLQGFDYSFGAVG